MSYIVPLLSPPVYDFGQLYIGKALTVDVLYMMSSKTWIAHTL